jgi:hypothetical protein
MEPAAANKRQLSILLFRSFKCQTEKKNIMLPLFLLPRDEKDRGQTSATPAQRKQQQKIGNF